MRIAYRNILVVVKQTPYEYYSQMRAQGIAPIALRWERLKNRYDIHRQCVDNLVTLLGSYGARYHVVQRQELHRGLLIDKDLIIAVGGDGTVLNSSSFVDDTIPVLGVNSDPTRPEEQGVTNVKDERRSRGALCGAKATNLKEVLPQLFYGDVTPSIRTRIQCLVRSTYTETRLPPSLNDILIAHPIPAAVSRFRLFHCDGTVASSYKTVVEKKELFSFNAWSSGMWVCTATGSTAAVLAAGGDMMDKLSPDLQYMIREHLVEENDGMQKKMSHGFINPSNSLHLRWNSQEGCAYVDGSHMRHELELGDELRIDSNAPKLNLFDEVIV
jgi:NAD+ kinase